MISSELPRIYDKVDKGFSRENLHVFGIYRDTGWNPNPQPTDQLVMLQAISLFSLHMKLLSLHMKLLLPNYPSFMNHC